MPIVYSTDPNPEPKPAKPAAGDAPAKGQTARIWRDSKRRKGKTVTVVGNLQHNPAAFERLCAELKKLCGAGGTVRDGEIEIQGDHRERIAAHLQQSGYRTKFVGG
ncbi:MAG: translation initiation factor [Chloroflexi bacterium]|nr:translation initiation factor [Chloroflexota bacterium]